MEQLQSQLYKFKTELESKSTIIDHIREQLRLREDAFQKLQKDYNSQNSSEIAKAKLENHDLQKELAKRDAVTKELKVAKYNVCIITKSSKLVVGS